MYHFYQQHRSKAPGLPLFILCVSLTLLCGCTRSLYITKSLASLRTAYAKDTTSHFSFYHPAGGFIDSSKKKLSSELEKYRADILRLMEERDYPKRVEVFFFPGKEEMNVSLDTRAEAISFAKINIAAFVFSRQFTSFTRHEIAHVLSINLWGGSALWIEEGFATLTDEDLQRQDFHTQAKRLLHTNGFIPAGELFRHFNQYNNNWNRYVEAASILGFVKENYGVAGLREVWRTGKLKIARQTEARLVQEWMAMLEERAG